ncbi:MAG: DUF58 domain-containing protein [Clostridiaceae bacterium]|jgi:uncharacterized protein (DUF58 family)|nr:DUF58 domain-containing protein [Clostridiaceae bacterium]
MTVLFVLLVLLIVPLLAGVSYFGLAVFKIALLFVLILLIYSIIEIIYLRSRLRIGQLEYQAETNRGDLAEFKLSISLQTLFLPAEISVTAWYGLTDRSLEAEQHLVRHSLVPGNKEEIIVSMEARHTGWLQLDEVIISLRGILGILQTKYRYSSDQENMQTLVLPLASFDATPAVNALRESKDGLVERKRVEDRSEEIDTLREYSPGDDIRRIHWQVSARLQSMMIKQYEEALEMRTAVLVDENTADAEYKSAPEWNKALSRRDLLLESTAGILHEFLNRELYVRLETGAGSTGGVFSRKIESLQSYRRQLALLPVNSTPEIGTLIVHELNQISADRYLLLTTRLSYQTVTTILKLKEQVRYVSLFFFIEDPPGHEMEEAFDRMRRAGVDVFVYIFASSGVLRERKKK